MRLGAAALVALVALFAANACGTDDPVGSRQSPGATEGASPTVTSSQLTEGALQQDMVARVRSAAIYATQRQASADYDFARDDEGRGVTHNVAQGLESLLTAEGMHIGPDDPECTAGDGAPPDCWSVVFRLAALRRGAERTALAAVAAEPVLDGNRGTLEHSPTVDEWYLNGPLGLEQGFVVAEPSGGADGHGGLVIEIEVSGDVAPVQLVEGGPVALRTATGQTALHYTDLFARDAADRLLPARMAVSAGTIELHVDDRDARYPVTIDPLIWTQMQKIVPAERPTSTTEIKVARTTGARSPN